MLCLAPPACIQLLNQLEKYITVTFPCAHVVAAGVILQISDKSKRKTKETKLSVSDLCNGSI